MSMPLTSSPTDTVWNDAILETEAAGRLPASEQPGAERTSTADSPAEERKTAPPSGCWETDVLVMGGGITGLTAALELLRRGQRVVVCEAQWVGAGTSAMSTGHLDAAPECGAMSLMDRFGEAEARQLTSLRTSAIDWIEANTCRSADFRRVSGFAFTEDDSAEPSLRREQVAMQDLGLETAWHGRIGVPRAHSGVEIQNLGRMNSREHIFFLADQVRRQGGQIWEHSPVATPQEEDQDTVQVGEGTVRFQQFIAAGGANMAPSLRVHLQAPAYQSYVVAVRTEIEIADALYWDDQSPYHYVRRVRSDDPNWLIVGGADHRTGMGHPEQSLDELRDYVADRYPGEITHTWSAQFYDNSDGLPIIGRVPGRKQHFLATGFSGTGLTWGTAAGRMLADMIEGKPVPAAGVLDPGRIITSGLGSLAVEQTKSAISMVGYVTPDHSVDPDDLEIGEGRIGKVDGHEVAVCRDAQGCVHRHSAVCPHMGGRLNWNPVEQTWDCPLHGGRFAADGRRLYGPPHEDMHDA